MNILHPPILSLKFTHAFHSVVRRFLRVAGSVLVIAGGTAPAQPFTIYSLAGRATPGATDGFRSAAQFYSPSGAAADFIGNVYVADTANSTIRRVAPDGTVTTIAGRAGLQGSDDGLGTNALFRFPQGIALAQDGSLLVADTGNHSIRKINTLGMVSTLAGAAGVSNSFDGPAASARFFHPEALTVSSSGDIYVSDTWNHKIRKITAAGQVSTVAGLAGNPGAADGTGSKARFNRPAGLALDSGSNLFVADFLNHTVRKITPAGVVTTPAGRAGIWGSTDGISSAARFYHPQAVVEGNSGEIYILDSGNHALRQMTYNGTDWSVTTVAGLAGFAGPYDGTGSAARFYFPSGLAKDGSGDLHIADLGNNTLRSDRIAPPFLQVSRSHNGVTVKWPASFINFGLESAPWLSEGVSWTTIASGIAVAEDSFQFTTNTLSPREFYRLKQK